MPPTVQTGNAGADRDRKLRPGEKRSDLVCRVKYCNTLPDIPFDPKFITYPFSANRFVDYKPTSLERNYKHDLLTEHDLGVTIDLINPDAYAIDPNATLHPDDERLLEEDTLTPQDSKRSRHHNKAVPWLKKTEYISNEFNRYGQLSEKTETKVGYNVKKLFKEENLYMDRESQISAINKTFSDAKIPITEHYSKPNVHAVDTYPIFPDFELWRYPFAQVIFDAEPVPPTMTDEMSQAMIRGVMDEKGEQFVAYFLPTEETMTKRKRDAENSLEYDDEDFYEYKMAREYNWNVKNKASKGYEENYFFVFRDNKVFYNELETRVRLNKRRLKPGVQPNSNSKLVVRHRTLNEIEFKTQEIRMLQLDQPQEEEEEEEIQVDAEKEIEADGENEAEEENEAGEDNNEAEEEKKKEASSSSSSSSSSSESDAETENKKEEKMQEDSDAEEEEKETETKKASSSSSSSPARSGSSSSSSSSSSESEAEDQNKRDEEEIFGSDSD